MKLYFILPLFFQKLIWIPTRFLLFFFGNLEVRGLDNLGRINGPVIFACNHSSEIDPFMVPASLPFFSRFSPLFYAVREKSFYSTNGWRKHLFNGWFINMWGGYSAAVGLRDYEASLKDHIRILGEGGNFCVFPEGGITRDGNLQPAKGGISYLAHSNPCAVIPVNISGVYGMSFINFFLMRRKIVVIFGEPLNPDKLYESLPQPHARGESVWRAEADFIMKKVGELVEG